MVAIMKEQISSREKTNIFKGKTQISSKEKKKQSRRMTPIEMFHSLTLAQKQTGFKQPYKKNPLTTSCNLDLREEKAFYTSFLSLFNEPLPCLHLFVLNLDL